VTTRVAAQIFTRALDADAGIELDHAALGSTSLANAASIVEGSIPTWRGSGEAELTSALHSATGDEADAGKAQ
jgi:hypothetical protein